VWALLDLSYTKSVSSSAFRLLAPIPLALFPLVNRMAFRNGPSPLSTLRKQMPAFL